MDKRFCENLKNARAYADMTQKQVAMKLESSKVVMPTGNRAGQSLISTC